MAASGEFIEIPYVLTSPYATLTLNAATGDRYLLLNGGCEMGAEIRSTSDPIPQADGGILHHRFFTGYAVKLAMQLWYNDAPACGADLVRMIDKLNGICWSLLNAGDNEGRLAWLPTGAAGYRMVDDVRLAERMTIIAPEAGTGWTVHFSLDAALPYAQDLTQTSTPLGATITNGGTAEYWPVFRCSGSSTFTIYNATTDKRITFDSGLPGGIGVGAYGVEIDTFRNTAYLITGSPSGPGDGADAMGSIDMTITDFWSLKVGANVCTISSGACNVLWQNAWA